MKEETIEKLVQKVCELEGKVKELERRYKALQEAFYKMYQDQIRRERIL